MRKRFFTAVGIALWVCATARMALVGGPWLFALAVPSTAATLEMWGLPEGTPLYTGRFVSAFDGRTRCPRWTLEYLDKNVVAGSATRGNQKFRIDARIGAEYRPTNDDYQPPYDRGHCAASGNYGDADDQAATFTLSNAAPEIDVLNQQFWRVRIEKPLHDRAAAGERLWIVTAPLLIPKDGKLVVKTMGEHGLWIPTHWGKAVLALKPGETEPHVLQAWIVPNKPLTAAASADKYRVSVDEFETAAGFGVFDRLRAELQDKLEAQGGAS